MYRIRTLLVAGCFWLLSPWVSAVEQPNILVIWGDDIGFWNLSTNNMGMMGYQTPNIDRIANEVIEKLQRNSERVQTERRR